MSTFISSQSRRGSALLVATAVLIILASIATVLSDTTVSGLKQEVHRTNDLRLAMSSESACNIGLDYLQRNDDLLGLDMTPAEKLVNLPTLSDLENGTNGTDISDDLPVAEISGMRLKVLWCYMGQRAVRKITVDGMPRLEVVAIGTADSMTQDVYYLRAHATVGDASTGDTWRTRRVETLFVPYPTNVFVRAMFAHRGYVFKGAATTDSWNSADGTVAYADQVIKGEKGDLGSEGDIYVQKPDNVKGSINDFINFPLPPVDFDEGVATGVPSALEDSTILTTGEYRYDYIKLDESTPVTIKGKVTIYVDGPVSIAAASPVFVYDPPDTSRLTLIQKDYDPADPRWDDLETEMKFNGNDIVGSKDNPQQFLYMSQYSGQITMNGNGQFGGALYFPNATFKLNGTFGFYGSIIADTFATTLLDEGEQGKVLGTFDFHYDEALANLRLPLPPRIGVVGWFTSNPRAGDP